MKTRRTFLKAAAAAPLMPAGLVAARQRPSAGAPPHVVVVGAGAFGGWSALHLLRGGARVTLVDSWGPGHSRASSGGDTRVIRGVYGANRVYVEMAARSFELWADAEKRWSRPLYRETGALWMLTGTDDSYARQALPLLKDAGLPFEELSAAEARARWPQVSFDGVRWALFERKAGYLLARRSCEAVAEAFVREGGTYRQAAATAGPVAGGALKSLSLGEGRTIEADAFVSPAAPGWAGCSRT